MADVATGWTVETFEFIAGQGWSVEALPPLDSERTLVLAFGGANLFEDPAPFERLRSAYPTSHLVGCSTAGEIAGTHIRDGGVSAAVMRFAKSQVRSVTAPVRSAADSYRAGELLANQLAGPSLKGVMVFSDGLRVNGSDLARGLNATLPPSVAVTGGLAADGDRFKRTWVIRNGQPTEGFVSAVGLYGEHLQIGHGSMGGWDTFGPERTITRSEGNILYELDGKPALPLYKQYLGERAADLPASGLLFPLALKGDDGRSLVRTILSIDEGTQAMIFAGDMPRGARARLMRANFDRLVAGAAESGAMARDALLTDSPGLAVAVSCVGRRLVLGQRTEAELESTLEALPTGFRLAGFYSYGELSPRSGGGGSCDLHNQTMTVTTIVES